MIAVADASPLIFLGKLRRLGLVRALGGRDIRVPRAVVAEALPPGLDPAEDRQLREFLDRCRIETVRRPSRFAAAMSKADNAALTLAVRAHADLLLCDERVTRFMAQTNGIRPLGTLGILLQALRAGHMTTPETREAVDELVSRHDFRIGVRLYQAVLARIESG